MDGLPFLPGNTFKDITQMKYHVSQTLGYLNGYAVSKMPERGIGGTQLFHNNLSEQEIDDLAKFNPTLTYGKAKPTPLVTFLPGHAAWDKKVLKFNAYFKQTVHESPTEHFCVRPVNIYYHLEDDSISVNEPHIENSGMPQGKLINRQRMPKNDKGDVWHWKNFNLGMDITFYGKNFHVTNCDKFTKNFLESEGIILSEPESIPPDPYLTKRAENAARIIHRTPASFDKLKQFKELDHKVLSFMCIWDDRESMFGEKRPFILHYYLVDDTMEILEVHTPNDGRDPFPVLIGRHRIPKDRFNITPSFPSGAMEFTELEVKEYFSPKDFQIGKTLVVYGRPFMIYDCDNFTKGFYYNHFGITNFESIDVKDEVKQIPKMEIPEYNNFGSLEGSLQSCISILPRVPKRDFIKLMENDHKELRFEAILFGIWYRLQTDIILFHKYSPLTGCFKTFEEEEDAMIPGDRGRRFIFTYRLADDTMIIHEPPVRNSGIIGGKFLERCRVARPGATVNNPVFYGPQNFYIGAVIEVFKHRFLITNADPYVLKYIEDHKSQFPEHTYNSIKQKVEENVSLQKAMKQNALSILRSPGDLDLIVKHLCAQLKKVAITDKTTIYELFLKFDRDRVGFIDMKNLSYLCEHLQLPSEDDILQALMGTMTKDPEGHISLEDFRSFIESL